jgi:ADP-ribosylglycohydrolase
MLCLADVLAGGSPEGSAAPIPTAPVPSNPGIEAAAVETIKIAAANMSGAGDAGFDLAAIAAGLVGWYAEGWWSARGEVFDIGGTTAKALFRLQQGCDPHQSGETGGRSNGNGSLMRILPLAFWAPVWPEAVLYQRVHQVSALTHAHPLSQMACGYYVAIAAALLEGASLPDAYAQAIAPRTAAYRQSPAFASRLHHFERVTSGAIANIPLDQIASSGYVLHTLEASLWCLLNTDNYAEAVLRAVNLGGDTDTTAMVTGGLAGIHYGLAAIPTEWQQAIARLDDILAVGDRLHQTLQNHPPAPAH